MNEDVVAMSYVETATGRIVVWHMLTPSEHDANLPPDCYAVPGAYDRDTVYFDGDTPKPRPTVAPVVLTGRRLTTTALPSGTTLDVLNADGDSITINRGQVVDFTDPGRYVVNINPPFPYQLATQVIEVI